jgi:hypothetical protein
MKIGIVLDRLADRSWGEVRETAQRAEASGIDALYLRDQGGGGGDPLLTAASLATATTGLRVTAEIRLGACHPVHIAEKVTVADNCLAGRLGIVLISGESPPDGSAPDDAAPDDARLAEAADIIGLALRASPFRYEGAYWRVPARLPENDQARWTALRVTPAPVQPALPVSTQIPLIRPWRVGEVDRLAAELSRLQDGLGLDEAFLALDEAPSASWRHSDLCAVRRELWPRVQLSTLPDGLSDFWRRHYPRRAAEEAHRVD